MIYLWTKFAKHKIRYKRHGRIDKHAKKGIRTHALPEREPYSAGNSRKDRRFTPDAFPMDQLGKMGGDEDWHDADTRTADFRTSPPGGRNKQGHTEP